MTGRRYMEMEESLYANAIGRSVLEYARIQKKQEISELVDSAANELLKKIWVILEDKNLNDSECFYRIDEIVKVFNEYGVATTRHSECE